ncbi:MAG: DUF4350 domain-containing protein [Dehalococcoidia bacterium]|nr:DUF4350 domain-containing protein [Dehalococcoidia bacterium]
MSLRKISLMVLAMILMLSVLVWFYPSSSDFEKENPSWNGASDFLDRFQATPLDSFDLLPAVPRETTLIVVPYLEFTSADLEQLGKYVSSGGNLVIMDDFGCGNEILEYLEVEARFSGAQLLDPLFNYKNKNFPRIFSFAPGFAGGEAKSVTFNHATCLEGVPPGHVAALSSYLSFLDEDQNGEWNEGETKGPLPVMAAFEVGEGRLTVVADPSILINGMLDMDGNREFLEEVCPGQIYLDQAHLPDVLLDEAKEGLRVARTCLITIWGTLGLIILVLALTLKPVWRLRPPGE